MRAIIHCPFCHSITSFGTDGNGRLTERLNHPCVCPPRAIQPAEELEKSALCVDCGKPVFRTARRCAKCGKVHNRAKMKEWHQAHDRKRKRRAAA
jgi:hypothetical protein